MRVSIEFCVVCNYEPAATALAAQIRETFPDAEITLLESGGCAFEVEVDGQLVFSKKRLGRHPEPGEVLRLMRAGQGVR